MLEEIPDLMAQIRARFAHVESCPFTGPRVFFENAGGALTLNSVVETSARLAAIPDNQGRANGASEALMAMIAKGRADMRLFFNAPEGEVIVGESGTELLYRLIRAACLSAGDGVVLGSTLEHPASRSAAAHWAKVAGMNHVLIPHDATSGRVEAEAYGTAVTRDTRVATIVHTSPVSGIGMDLPAIAAAIRAAAPDCLIIVDGIQHAAHGGVDVTGAQVDGYVVSAYKMFARHGYGVAWLSDRLAALPHEHLVGAPGAPWEMGTRDTAAYATFSDVVGYLDWLGGELGGGSDPRRRLEAAAIAIRAHEAALCKVMLEGADGLRGLAGRPGITVVGGGANAHREGLVTFAQTGHDNAEIVAALNARGIRTHLRKADHYSGAVLTPLGIETSVRVSLCHYNTMTEVRTFLEALEDCLN
ncbi:aminotransferase class V-fold PLP-dependent enzyme [Dinoroseobacter sp. S76]|uniref:aminotransferase class V-fold PLP-dependent enzyme n=1 Tax=Dinoroseobacter sp. S76 TaxID=3415124 RepID=UPI003C7CC297